VTAFLIQIGVELVLAVLDPFFWIGVSQQRDRRSRDRRIWQATELQ
jgi:hypothetical protein